MAFDLTQPIIPFLQSSANWFRVVTEDGEVYQLTSTQSARVESMSKSSTHKVLDKTVITDNTVAYNRKISYNGIITSVERLDQEEYKPPSEYLEGLEKVRNSRQLVTVELDDQVTPITNCSFSNFAFSKGKSEGLTTWVVDLSFQEIRLSEAATATTVANPQEAYKDPSSPKTDGGNATTEAKPLTTTNFQELSELGL